jgi:hypothetical protein
MGARRSNAWRKVLASWDVTDRKHATARSMAGRGVYFGWWKSWQVMNSTRPRKDRRVTRKARRRAKRELQQEIELWDVTDRM